MGCGRKGQALAGPWRAGINVSRNEALRWITINPAWALGIDDRTGTIEVGKQADVVLWSGDPFSVYTHADQVWIDGVSPLRSHRPIAPAAFQL